MENYSVYLPSYSIGDASVYKKIPEICGAYGKTAVVIGGKTAMEKAKADLLAGIEGSDIRILDFIWYGDDATFENCDALAANPVVQEADMVFGVGGGRALDTCKTMTDQIDKPLFVFPTIGSNCAAVTLVCVMYKPDHTYGGLHFRKAPALHTFINMKIIAEAPTEYLWAGIGDALSKQYEVVFSARGDELDHTNQLGIDLARHCSDPLLKYGVQAYEDAKAGTVSHPLTQVVLNILVTTGLISVLIDTNKYNGSVSHTIYYASTVIEECEKNHLHGEIVGYGNLPLLMLDKDMEAFHSVFEINRAIGLPTRIGEIGIPLDSEEYNHFLDVAEKDNNIVHGPFTITRDMLDQAIRDVEAYNDNARG